jgi:hypothetical protein
MKPYTPNKLPLKTLDLTNLIPLIAKANIELGRYDGGLKAVPNPNVLLSHDNARSGFVFQNRRHAGKFDRCFGI